MSVFILLALMRLSPFYNGVIGASYSVISNRGVCSCCFSSIFFYISDGVEEGPMTVSTSDFISDFLDPVTTGAITDTGLMFLLIFLSVLVYIKGLYSRSFKAPIFVS